MSNVVSLDGRTARRDGSRRKLLLAGLRQVEKGNFRFSLQDVADYAKMHRRSIHDIFGDFDGYLRELIDEHEASIQAAVQEAVRSKEISLARLVILGQGALMATRRPKPEAAVGHPPITRQERYWAGLYGAFMERYAGCNAMQVLPIMAAKLFAKRVGFDRFMHLLIERGTAAVAERCRNELVERQHFLAHMIATYPPDDPAEWEGAIQDMAEDLATIDSEEGALRMLKYLERLRNRELMLRATQGTLH